MYKIQHITNKNKLTNRKMIPEYLTIHSTSNLKSTAQNERDNLNREGNTTSTGFHIVVDEKEAIECIPFDMVAYHAGDGANGTGNTKSIGLEICENGNRNKTIENAVEISAKILHERNWGIDRLKRHYDWSKKNCPRILNYNNWQGWSEFKSKVQAHLNLLIHKPHWAETHYNNLVEKGFEIHEKRYNDNITRGEVFALLDRITDKEVK
ncbi:MAG TPA: N-acetylmuramoyl-L-alanine amidase [Tissierellia bacterium]|nr:N-acetylmuramoyl-L-alanine amidase [Tissierellia bacterium]